MIRILVKGANRIRVVMRTIQDTTPTVLSINVATVVIPMEATRVPETIIRTATITTTPIPLVQRVLTNKVKVKVIVGQKGIALIMEEVITTLKTRNLITPILRIALILPHRQASPH